MPPKGFNYKHCKDSFLKLSNEAPALLQALTEEVVHHLWCMVRGGGDPQELFPPGHRRVIDCLDVDVMSAHEFVTDLCVFSSICNLSLMRAEGQVATGWTTS